jgi:hypothetical protein
LLYTHARARLQVAHERIKARARLWMLSARVASWVYEAQVRRYHTRLLARHYVKTVVVRLTGRAWLGWNSRRKLLGQVFRLRCRTKPCLRAVLHHLHWVARHLRDTARHLVCAAARCAPCFLPSIASCLDSFQQSRERERESCFLVLDSVTSTRGGYANRSREMVHRTSAKLFRVHALAGGSFAQFYCLGSCGCLCFLVLQRVLPHPRPSCPVPLVVG